MRAFLIRLTRQWQLKLLAFALAMLLWVVVSGEQLQSRLLPVPLEVRVTDPAYQLIESSIPSEVDVRFVGPGREFIEMALRRPEIGPEFRQFLRCLDLENGRPHAELEDTIPMVGLPKDGEARAV